MGEKSYFIDLEGAKACRIRVYMKTEKGVVVDLMVQLEFWRDAQWAPVARYDCAHGELHIDILHNDGLKEKRFLGENNLNQAVTNAIADLKRNWMSYLRRTGHGKEEE